MESPSISFTFHFGEHQMIQLQNVTKFYHSEPAVDEVSFTVEEGETLVLLGKSGSGKTTLLKMINRLIDPEKGDIFFRGNHINKIRKETLRRNIGYVIQATGLFPHMTVEENIRVVPLLLKWPHKDIDEQVTILLERMGLPATFRSRYPNELSGGQQQRVGIARALAGKPALLLMDEPFGALDPVVRKEIQQDFLKLDLYRTFTKIIVTHDVKEAFVLADRIALIEKGKLVEIGTPHQLAFSSSNKLVKHFLGEDLHPLKLSLILLKDILPFLKFADGAIEGSECYSLEDKSLLQIFSSSAGPEQTIQIIKETGTLGTVKVSDLQAAFMQYERQQEFRH